MLRPASALLAIALLAACGSTPPGTLTALSRFDPMTDDLSALGARIEHPAGIEIRPGDARVELSARREDGENLLATLPLSIRSAAHASRNQVTSEFTVSEADLEAVESFRSQVSAWKAAGHRVTGSVTVSVAGCGTAAEDDRPLPSSVWLKLNDETGYLPLRRNIDLRDLAAMDPSGALAGDCGDG